MSDLPDFSLKGKVALVTGASRGIGKAIAETFASAGAKVVLASRKMADLQMVAEEICEAGGEALAVPAHTGDPEAVTQLVQKAIEAYGGIDILVNNAGTNPHFGPLMTSEVSHWQKILDVNLVGCFHTIKACVGSMSARGGGSVINLASVAGIEPQPGMGIYSISKAGVIMLTKVLAGELAEQKIRVNAIAPGFIKTKFSSLLWQTPEIYEATLKIIPQKRMGEVSELTGIALYLASTASSFTTGSVFVVDGGQTANHPLIN